MRHVKSILFLIGGLLFVTPAKAQASYVLYASLIRSQGYVAGTSLTASGLYRLDEAWTHIGWNNPRVLGVAYDPTNPDMLFLACGNGVLRSRDGGASWRIVTGWRVTDAQDVAVDPNAPLHVYVGTAFGVWASKDGGDTWNEMTSGLAQAYTDAVAVDRTRAGRVFAGMEGGLFVSEDGGTSWTRVAAYEDVRDVRQSAADPQLWLAGTQNDGMLLSHDGGQTWRQVSQESLQDAAIYAVAPDPADASRVAAAGWDTGVLVSTDGGGSWARRGHRLPTSHFYRVLFDPNTPGRLWAATVEAGIFYSDDLGITWTTVGMDGTLVFDMDFIPRTGETP